MLRLDYGYADSPIGPLLVAGDSEGVWEVRLPHRGRPAQPDPDWVASEVDLVDALRQLDEYFRAERREFELPLRPAGTDFQRAVWDSLEVIPYGETWSYGQVAHRLGRPTAARAVGAAAGANPLPIVVPCHRVIGSNGALTGFGGGLRAKQVLLDLERRVVARR